MLVSYRLLSFPMVITNEILGPTFSYLILLIVAILLIKFSLFLSSPSLLVISLSYFLSISLLLALLYISDPGIQRSSPLSPPLSSQDRIYCDLCHIYQDPTTNHCHLCQYCILNQAHHCSWIGKCIGKKNLVLFKIFNTVWISGLFYTLLLFAFMLSSSAG
jgi:palmitoyltransferase ZDHHC9/14/18